MNRVTSHGKHFGGKGISMPHSIVQLYMMAKMLSESCQIDNIGKRLSPRVMRFDEGAKSKLDAAVAEYEREIMGGEKWKPNEKQPKKT